jgi:cytochrome P450
MDALFKKLVSQCKLERSRPTIFSQVFKDESAAQLTEKELVANAFIFFIAGHDSTGTALGWGLTKLAEFPEVQEKIHEEITRIIGDRAPQFDDLKELVYLDCFIKEVLRFHPPAVLAVSRIATKDVTYKNYTIPKGSIAGVHIYSVHHSESLFPDADTFNPDRFMTKDFVPYSYIPFSLGTRPCIGKFFSLLEQRLFYVRMIQEFKILRADNFCPRERTKTMLLTGPEQVSVQLKKRIN